jgi:hypothetical protein
VFEEHNLTTTVAHSFAHTHNHKHIPRHTYTHTHTHTTKATKKKKIYTHRITHTHTHTHNTTSYLTLSRGEFMKLLSLDVAAGELGDYFEKISLRSAYEEERTRRKEKKEHMREAQ